MIKIKYKILSQTDNRVELFVLYDNNTFTILNLAQDTLENMLKNAYILTSNAANRLPYTEEAPIDLETYDVTPVATTLSVDNFNNSIAKVYDQYGQPMEAQVEFSVEGTTKAKYEEGTLIEDEVTEDTPYYVAAKYGDLEEKQKRFLYAPVEPVPNELDMANHKINALVSEQEMTNDLLQEIILNMYQ